MTQILKINKLNKLHAEFFKLVDHKMALENMETGGDNTYPENVRVINNLTASIDDVRRQIKMLSNEGRQYTLEEMMQAVYSYVSCTTILNKSIAVTPKPTKIRENNKFRAECIKTDNTRAQVIVTIQPDGFMYAFDGSMLRNIAEFIK